MVQILGREEKGIILALINDQVEVVNTYLELNNTVNIQLSLEGIDRPPIMRDSPPLISVAIFLSAKKCVAALSLHKANLSVTDSAGRAPIHFAAAGGELEMLETLAIQGADLRATDNKGRSILHYAAQFSQHTVAQWIFAHHLELQTEDEAGYTPLHFAAEAEDIRITELLISNGMKQTKSHLGVSFSFIGHRFSLPQRMTT